MFNFFIHSTFTYFAYLDQEWIFTQSDTEHPDM